MNMRLLVSLVLVNVVWAQGPPAAAPKPPPTPRAAAPVDFTGTWVSVVTEDWRWRMVTPIKGDFASIPLNMEARNIGNAWVSAKDQAAGLACKAYGAPGVMRLPGRVRISWTDDNTLKLETDQGQQTRLFHFNAKSVPAGTQPDWQGYSIANWEQPVRGEGPPQLGLGMTRRGARGRSLEVVTTNLRAGYLRKNGVPYSDKAVVREFFDLSTEPNGSTWFVVTTIVEDPAYLTEPFVTSTNFKKEPDASKFEPVPCSAK
jgi:hypothetical protein